MYTSNMSAINYLATDPCTHTYTRNPIGPKPYITEFCMLVSGLRSAGDQKGFLKSTYITDHLRFEDRSLLDRFTPELAKLPTTTLGFGRERGDNRAGDRGFGV